MTVSDGESDHETGPAQGRATAPDDVMLLTELPPIPEVTGPPGRLLERVAVALNSSLELDQVLGLLAEAGLEATGAGGTAVLLLEGRSLVPATVVRHIETEGMQERFHGMKPYVLDDFRWELLHAGRAILFEDARDTDLIPGDLVDRFSLRGFALVPLMAGGRPYGVMCVDWDEVRTFSANDVALLEAFGTYAGFAVRNARVYETMRRRAGLQEALAHAAATLASPLEPPVIVDRLAGAYTELLGARCCEVVLFQDDLDTITSVAAKGVPALAPGTRLSDVPRAVVDPLVDAWVGAVPPPPVEMGDHPWLAEEFGGRAAGAEWYLFLPLVVDGPARGAVTLGFAAHTLLDEHERSAAVALADIASAALERHALLHRLDALYEASAALNSSTSLSSVLDLVCRSFETLLDTTHCSVNLLSGPDHPDVLTTLVHRGVSWFAARPRSVGAVAPAEVARARARWVAVETPQPVVYPTVDEGLAVDPLFVPPTVRSAALFPLLHAGDVVGVVVAGFPQPGGPGDADLDTGLALARLAATAIDRAQLDDSLRLRLQQVEALYRLSDVVAGTTNLDAAVRELNRRFEPELGVAFGSVAIANADAREAVGARAPDDDEAEAIRSWRAAVAEGAEGEGDGGPGEGDALQSRRVGPTGLLVPVVHRSRVYGALRVTVFGPWLEPSTEELLAAIGAGCAEIVYKAGLQRDVADRERRLAIATERERIARDLHDSVGQVLTGMGMLLTEYSADAPDAGWRRRLEELIHLADRGAREVRDSVDALMFLETRQIGLEASLRALTRKFEEATGIVVALDVDGDAPPTTAVKDDALFRVAHEALMNIERHAHASKASIALRYGRDEMTLTIRDDGVGLASGTPCVDDGRTHFGLAALERRLDEVGGELCIDTADPTGAVVEARVPVKTSFGRSHPTA